MPDDTLAERLAATCQAIKRQQQVATSLAGALAELVTETERMATQTWATDLAAEGSSELLQVMPGTPKALTSALPPAKLAVRSAWGDASNTFQPISGATRSEPQKRTSSRCKSTVEERGERLQACADSLQARKNKASKGRVFADPDDLRDQIRENLTEEIHDPFELYKDAGLCQAMVKSHWFETASAILVCASSVWMAVEIDHNHGSSLYEADAIFPVVAHLLCVLFSLEILVRLCAFRHLIDAMKEFWIVFDLVLVLLLVIEVWILGTIAAITGMSMGGDGMKLIIVFRVLRLLRIMRLAHVLKHLPELLVIIRGLVRALRAIAVVLVLIGLNIYIAALVFTAVLDGSTLGRESFPTVSTSMGTLLLDCTLSGSRGTAIMRKAWDEHPALGVMVLVFVLLSNVTFFGVLTGMLVQTIKTTADLEKEEKLVKHLVSYMDELWKLIVEHDTNDDGKIDVFEFTEFMSDKQTAKVLSKYLCEVDLDVEGLANVAPFAFEQHEGNLGREEFLKMVLDIRHSKKATVKDHIETRKFTQAALLRMFKVEGGKP